MFFKLTKHRKFDYTPRIYSSQKKDGDKPSIDFRSLHHRHKKSRSFIWLLFLLFFVVYMIILLSKIAHNF